MGVRVTRRELIQAGAGSAVALLLGRLGPLASRAARAAPPRYADWRDVYRKRWRWDRIARGTHTNANCVSSCAWNLYVREGVVFREEQSAPYAASNAEVPDFNPRGCQKGASCSDLLVGPTRVMHPLRRVGPRHSGRFRRISWEEAFEAIAAELVSVLARRGGEGVICELGPNVDYGPHTAAGLRFFRQIGAPLTDSMAQIGDLAVGGTITLGTPHTDGSSDDWFRSRHLVLWAMNPAATRIPDAHFLTEARYRGARITCIAPDYNQSAIHADLWLSPRPGTDLALALAASHVIVEEGLLRKAYVAEQTDLPFLVREDTGRLLREADLRRGGSEERFAFYDEESGRVLLAPGCAGSPERTLELPPGVRPALEADPEVELADGRRVRTRTVFARLRAVLASCTPEWAARETGLHPDLVRHFARLCARQRPTLILSQWGACKNLHSDLLQRAQILLASLTGNLGLPGGGWRSGAFVALDGLALLAMQDDLDLLHLGVTALRAALDPEAVRRRFERMYVSSTLFHLVHGSLAGVATVEGYGDRSLPRSPRAYLDEALRSGAFPIGPPAGSPPEIIFSLCGNVLRHSRSGHRLRRALFDPARLVVAIDFRMSETARHADFFLPAAGWYEKIGIKYIPAFVPYLTLADRAVAPLGDARPEWRIFAELAEHVAAEALRRRVDEIRGFDGEPRRIADLGERFTDGGRFGPNAEEEIVRFLLSVSGASRGVSLEDLRERGGALRIRSLGPEGGTAGIYSPYSESEPVVPLRDFVEGRRPYPTLTGRQQFYIDHPWFLEAGEALPVHKPPPAAGGDHPFTLTGGHTRWSIHAMWRDHALMLRLQRGEPVVLVNDAVARARGIADHDLVRVRNDLGSFVARAVPSPAIRPEQIHIFHAWEPYQFRGGRSHQHLAPSPVKVTQLATGYGQLHWGYAHYEPNQVDRDTRVDLERLEGTREVG